MNSGCDLTIGPCACGAWHNAEEIARICDEEIMKMAKEYGYGHMERNALFAYMDRVDPEFSAKCVPFLRQRLYAFKVLFKEVASENVILFSRDR